MNSQQSLVVHVSSQDSRDWGMALQNIVNLVNDESVPTPPELIQVVVNGHAVRYLLASAPEATQLTKMTEAGVEIAACENSLERFGHSTDDLAEGVTTVPSGVAEVVRVQQRGNTYLKLP